MLFSVKHYLPTSELQAMLTDPDEAVRRVLAYRVPMEFRNSLGFCQQLLPEIELV